jgi:hypothetical protein
MQIRTLLLEILPNLIPTNLHDTGVLNRSRDLHLLIELAMHRVLDQLSQDAAERLARARLGDHAFALDHTAQGGDGADLRAYEILHFSEELVGGDGGGGVVGGGERYEGEGEVAFEGVGDADDAAFCDGGVGGDGLFYGACGDQVSFFQIQRTLFKTHQC